MLFGLVYSTTVARFPKGIFVLAASILFISLLLLSRVHPHSQRPADMKKQQYQTGRGKKKGFSGRLWDSRGYGHGYGYGPGTSGPEPDTERGRSRVSKDLSGNGMYRSNYPAPTLRPNGDAQAHDNGELEAGRAYGST